MKIFSLAEICTGDLQCTSLKLYLSWLMVTLLFENYVLKDFKNRTADLSPVLALVLVLKVLEPRIG